MKNLYGTWQTIFQLVSFIQAFAYIIYNGQNSLFLFYT